MGTDCALIVDGELHRLDRWWVFSRQFTSGEAVSKQEALHRIAYLGASLLDTPGTRSYNLTWHAEAKAKIEASISPMVVFIHEHDRDRCLYGPRVRREFERLGISPGATWDYVARQLFDPAWGGFSVEIQGGGAAFTVSVQFGQDRFGFSVSIFEVCGGIVETIAAPGEPRETEGSTDPDDRLLV